MSIGVIASHAVSSSGGGTPTFVARSAVTSTGTSWTLAAHTGTQVGDRQIVAVATFSSVTLTAPAGWTQIARYTTTFSSIVLYTRTLDSSNIGSSVTQTTGSGLYVRAEMRTYRSVTAFTVAGNGAGLVAPARTVAAGMLLRWVANAATNQTQAGAQLGTLTPDAALVDSSGAVDWQWYAGLIAGDDPASPGSVPSRTATDTHTTTTYPQWVDVQVT